MAYVGEKLRLGQIAGFGGILCQAKLVFRVSPFVDADEGALNLGRAPHPLSRPKTENTPDCSRICLRPPNRGDVVSVS